MNKKVVGVLVVVVIAAGISVAVMHNKDNKGDNSMSMSSSSSGSNANVKATDKVDIKGFAFSPTTIKIKKGAVVTWTNQDSTAHTVTSTDNGGMDSGSLAEGQTYSFTFDKTGTFSYKCSFHPDMMGTVIVQ